MTDQEMLDSLPDPLTLRSILGCFATGVTVVTTEHNGEYYGMTANSFTSVSLDPPLVLACFDARSRTAAAVARRGEFVVNILSENQVHLSHRFARPAEDHFADARLRVDDHGLPILLDGLGHVACAVAGIQRAGDHEIVLGEVRHALRHDGPPLVFFQGGYRRLAEDHINPPR